MKRYVFYLRPKRRNMFHQSSIYFSVIIAANINQAVIIFSERYHLMFHSIIAMTKAKFQINFKDCKGNDETLLTYVVIEEKKTIFDKKR
ncbi:hypothetical protein NIE88_00285 [Sporolactobacillus shoreicorticis]|uniref:Uncharacterized protein n=1 Tax=Sporolactobacillus shoreicorticis TaxID=1923877 RepID=A0ABW5S3Y9_9BACL|nr:hypothetical protein [Sporolactobacillus shoreicorticis]MCO7124228.1 hypothetical protein [Sporolactobacillus shoreicorticis]